MTVTELREHAKNLGIKGYSRMNKKELQDAIGLTTIETGVIVPENNGATSSEESSIAIIDERPSAPAADLVHGETKTVFDAVVEKQEEMSAAANAENINPENNSDDLSDIHFTLKMNGMPRHVRRKFIKLAGSKIPAKREEAQRILASFA